MSNRSNLLLPITLGGVLISFIAMMVIMWRIGFFSFNGSDSSSKVVAAALALVGAFVGTVVSMVGILLKHSIDQQGEIRQNMESKRNTVLQAEAERRLQIESNRNAVLQAEAERRLQIESDRNAALQKDAEQRLKLEAAVRALQLFSTSNGSPAPPSQRDGALFALDSLGQYELTLLILESLLDKKDENLSPGTASAIFDHAILRGSTPVQIDAINILETHAASMITPSGLALPWSLADWAAGLSEYVRERAPIVMARIIMARPVAEWTSQFEEHINAIIAALCLAWQEEQVPRLKRNIGVILNEMFKAFPFGDFVVYHPRKAIDVGQIQGEVVGLTPADLSTSETVQRLSAWREGKARSAQPHR